MSPSDHEDENDPDGQFAFRRKKHCNYYAVRENLYFSNATLITVLFHKKNYIIYSLSVNH